MWQISGVFIFLSVLITITQPATAGGNLPFENQGNAEANVILRGRVTDLKTGQPLQGATIFITDDKKGAIADQDGRFFIRNISSGHHVIEISHTGYTTHAVHIELTQDLERDFALSPVILENQGVIVTGVSGATSSRKMPVPVATLRRSELLQNSSTNIIDAISIVPGVSQVSTGPAISKPVIRGLGFNRVVVINEGIRQEGQQWGEEHGIEIDELSVAKVEVIKGPASLIYGSDALAGVIQFISNIPVEEGMTKGRFLSNYQSNNGLFALHGNIAGNRNGFNYNVYGTGRSAADYRNRFDGKVLNSRFRENNVGGYAGLNKSWGYSHIIFSRFHQQAGIVEGDRDPVSGAFLLYPGSQLERLPSREEKNSREILLPYQRISHNKIVSDNSVRLRSGRLKFNIGYQQNIREEFGDPEHPDDKELVFDLKTINYNVHWQMPDKKEWHSAIGINGMKQFNRNRGEELLIPDYNLFDFGLFFFTQRSFDKINFSGGLRFDNRNLDGRPFTEGTVEKFTAFKKSFSNFSASAGISAEITDRFTLKLNFARGFRAPSLPELTSNGAHEGSNRYEYGNRNLGSETSLQADAGIDFGFEHMNFSFSAFVNSIDNFIYSSKLVSVNGGDSLVDVDGEDLQAFRFNQQKAVLHGAEIAVDLHPHPLDWLHFENTFAFVRGNFRTATEGVRFLPLIPAPKITSILKADIGKWGRSLKQVYIKTGIERNFRQKRAFTAYDTETETPGYTLWNAGLGGDVTNKDRVLFSFHFSVTNITDAAWQNHLSRLKYADVNNLTGRAGVFNAGRNFSFRVQVPFSYSAKTR